MCLPAYSCTQLAHHCYSVPLCLPLHIHTRTHSLLTDDGAHAGYAGFLFWARDQGLKLWLLKHIVGLLIWLIGTLSALPVLYNAPLTSTTASQQHHSITGGKAQQDSGEQAGGLGHEGEDEQPQSSHSTPRFPVVIMSHG